MSYRLFLDDERVPTDVMKPYFSHVSGKNKPLYLLNWYIARDYTSFISIIEQMGVPEIVSYDHDLGKPVEKFLIEAGLSKRKARKSKKEEKTGLDCVKWLINHCSSIGAKFPDYEVHSLNPIGRENIISLIENYKKHENSHL